MIVFKAPCFKQGSCLSLTTIINLVASDWGRTLLLDKMKYIKFWGCRYPYVQI